MQSITVLPFKNISKNAKDDYLQYAIAIEISHLLSQHKNLRVISYLSSIGYYKNASLSINADILVEGAILRNKNSIRVMVQFVQNKDKTCLFSIKFDEKLDNLTKVIDKISLKVVEYFNLKLTETKVPSHINPEAYGKYLKGLYYWNLWDETNVLKAIDCFTEAIKIESDFAQAYARLSNCWSILAALQKDNVALNYKNSKEMAMKAVELNDSLLEAHLSLALIKLINDLDVLGAFHSLKKAFTLNNHSYEAHYYYAYYLMVIGKYDHAIEKLEYALYHNPHNVQMNSTYGFALSIHGKYVEAEAQLKKTLTLAPNSSASYDALFWNYILAGRYNEAKELHEGNPEQFILSPATQIVVYHYLGMKKERNIWFEKLQRKMNADSKKSYYREASIAYLTLDKTQKAYQYFEEFYRERTGFIIALTHPGWKQIRESRKFYIYKKRLKLRKPPLLPDNLLLIGDDIIVINSSTNEKLSVFISKLLYIESQGVYVNVVWKHEGMIQNKLLRVSLKNIIDQSMNPKLYRCHNSYIINTAIPFKIIGNRKNLKLIPIGTNIQIPVSRSKSATIEDYVETISDPCA